MLQSIEVFKTNIQLPEHAAAVGRMLYISFPTYTTDFDLEDCDRVLRVKGSNILPEQIMNCVRANGFECEILE